jgi:tRNA dimethylallyltransferase
MTGVGAQPQGRPGMVVLFGPTASGKSDLALRLADAHRGTVINADSMQLYRDLRILTARPGPELERRAPDELADARAAGRMPVVVGGTGLYVRALLDGIAPVPAIPADVRAEVRRLHARDGTAGVRRRLHERDRPGVDGPMAACDPQRLMRALEVVLATGRTLRDWQAAAPRRLDLPGPRVLVALAPPRDALHERIELRLRAMVANGALDEVRALRALQLAPDHPLMKAVAVRPLLDWLDGGIDPDTAFRRAIIETRRYAKRQYTWLRHRMPDFSIRTAFGEAIAVDALPSLEPHGMAGAGEVRQAEPGVDGISGGS